MLAILSITGPIYLIIALGYVTTRVGLFKSDDVRVLGRFVINIAMPALVFSALASRPFGEFANLSYLAAYTLGTMALVTAGYVLLRFALGQRQEEAAMGAMGMTCSNSGFVGFPVILLIYPSLAGNALALNMFVENLLLIPALLILAERGIDPNASAHSGLVSTLKRVAAMPLFIAIAAGALVSLSGIAMPLFLARTLDLLAQASAPSALFFIGGTLHGVPMKGMARKVAPVVVGKLIALPAFVALVIWLLPLMGLAPLGEPYATILIVMAAMPIIAVYPIFAQRFGEEKPAAVAQLATTVLSFFSVSALLWLLSVAPPA